MSWRSWVKIFFYHRGHRGVFTEGTEVNWAYYSVHSVKVFNLCSLWLNVFASLLAFFMPIPFNLAS